MSSPMPKALMALPLFSGGMTSAMVAPPMVPGPDPAMPVIRRNARNVPRFCASEQPTRKPRVTTMQTR